MSKVEMSSREAFISIAFVFLVILSVALVQAGIITNPLTLGLLITLTIVLIFVGHYMVKVGIISRESTPVWYVFVFGLVMLVYGGINAGFIPLAFVVSGASVAEVAITNSMFYVLVIVAVLAALLGIYKLSKKARMF